LSARRALGADTSFGRGSAENGQKRTP